MSELAVQFIATLGENSNLSGLELIVKMFDFVDENEQARQALGVNNALASIRGVLEVAVKRLFEAQPARRDEVLLLVTNLFSDTADIGTLVSLLMKAVDELKTLSGRGKKELAKKLFDKLIEYSPLDEGEKRLAGYAFSGIVEAVIWAKHGGLAETKKRCSTWCSK